MKLLIAIPACSKYDYGQFHMGVVRPTDDRIDGVRRTWWRDISRLTTDHEVVGKMFYGRGLGRELLPDEVVLDVSDEYGNLPTKMLAIYQWALEQGFDYVYKCDDDTFVYVERLLNSCWQEHDYYGFADPDFDYDAQYISGGSGYFLSRKSMQLMVNGGPPQHWAEDFWSGKILRGAGIVLAKDNRFLVSHDNQHFINIDTLPEKHDYISLHACSSKQMLTLYSRTREVEPVADKYWEQFKKQIVILGRVTKPGPRRVPPVKPGVTVVMTACGRPDLLDYTLRTFQIYNTYPVKKFVIVEDRPGTTPPANLPPDCEYIANEENLGQIASIDKAYKEIQTPYIFHCEEDWQFYRHGFIEESMEILERYPDILLVWIREHNDTNLHPVERLSDYPFDTMVYGFDKVWHGFTFNPGLRRLADYQRIGSYSEHTAGKAPGLEREYALSEVYADLGYRAAITPHGYVRHTGNLRSTAGENAGQPGKKNQVMIRGMWMDAR